MKKLVPLALVLLPVLAIAQKNAVKVNLSSLALRNYHIQYERKVLPKITINVGLRVMPKGKLPFQDLLEKYAGLDNPDLRLGDFEIGNTAITIEPRFYVSKAAMKGFYIAPYLRYSSFDLKLPFTYEYDHPINGKTPKDADFTGKVNAISGGVMLGTQFNIAKRLVLDIWWIGGHYGSSSGDLSFASTLTPQEEQGLENTLRDFDPSPFKITWDVNSNGAKIKSDGPWAGFRGLGINLGFRF